MQIVDCGFADWGLEDAASSNQPKIRLPRSCDPPATETPWKLTNPTHGSGWIIQLQPTKRYRRNFGIPPTEVGGLFRSGLQNQETTAFKRDFRVMHSANVDEHVGSEQSTNFRWWDSRTRLPLPCRPDLNHPPTPVGGISEFPHRLYREVLLTSCHRTYWKLRNPTHGSGWIIQIQPTKRGFDFAIPPTEVGGLFRSGLQKPGHHANQNGLQCHALC